MHLSLAEFKALVRDQAFLLQLEPERAVEALASLVPKADARKELLKQVNAIVGAGDLPITAERDRLAQLSQVLAAPIEKPAALVPSGRASVARLPRGAPRPRTDRNELIHAHVLGAGPVGLCPAMQTIVNKTFEEIAVGDAASVQRTLQAGDVRAWAAAFGEVDMLTGPGESQGAAGIVTAILTALVGSALPGPGTSIRTTSVQISGALPIGAAMTARLVVREKRSDQGIVVLDGQCTDPAGQVFATAILEVLAPTTRQQYAGGGASARGTCRTLSKSQADADRRGAPMQR